MTQVNRDIKILISHPFCLPYGNSPVNRYSRREKLEALREALGDNWEIFDIDGILPAVMKKRKDVLLKYKTVDNKYMYDFAVELNKPYENVRKVVSVTHSAYMWDFGLCAVDVLITLRLTTSEGLLALYPFAEAFEEEMLEKDLYKPPNCETWQQVQNMFLKGFMRAGMKTIHWLTSSDAPTFLLETCCWNLIMTLDKKETGTFASREVLERCLTEFCGENATSECFDTGVYEFYASHTGYSGNVAIVINEHEALRVQWLYKVVAILYSALLESADPCYDLVVDLIENDGSTPKSVADIRLVQKVIDVLHAEANPIAICSESFDAEIYDKVWNCWGGNDVDAMIDKRTEFLMHTLADLSEQKSQNLQMRLNFVVFVLTIFSIASTIAAIIELLDAETETAQYRALILAILTGIVGLACAIVVAIDVAGIIKSCRTASASSKRRKRGIMRRSMLGDSFNQGGGELNVKVVSGDD